jgi:hypothetical protein
MATIGCCLLFSVRECCDRLPVSTGGERPFGTIQHEHAFPVKMIFERMFDLRAMMR